MDFLPSPTSGQLDTDDGIGLLQDAWEESARTPELVGVTDEARAELDRRLGDHRADPRGSDGSTVKARILAR